MSFSIKCNKCGSVVEKLVDRTFSGSNNETLSDEESTITVSSVASWESTSYLDIQCKCGNEA